MIINIFPAVSLYFLRYCTTAWLRTPGSHKTRGILALTESVKASIQKKHLKKAISCMAIEQRFQKSKGMEARREKAIPIVL